MLQSYYGWNFLLNATTLKLKIDDNIAIQEQLSEFKSFCMSNTSAKSRFNILILYININSRRSVAVSESLINNLVLLYLCYQLMSYILSSNQMLPKLLPGQQGRGDVRTQLWEVWKNSWKFRSSMHKQRVVASCAGWLYPCILWSNSQVNSKKGFSVNVNQALQS